MRVRSGAVRRFFKTPKGILIFILAVFVFVAAPHEGVKVVAPGLLAAIFAAGLVDALILRIRNQDWEFPSGAVLTAMIVAMVLRAQEPWHVVAITSLAGVVSKYMFRSLNANVFNPAALAVVGSYYFFHTGQSWWGAMPELGPAGLPVLLVGGIFIAARVNKMPLVVAFLLIYYLLFTITAFVTDPGLVAEIYRAPDLQAALFFALIILTDPPTSPVRHPDQIVCGILVAVVSFGVFQYLGAVYYLLAGVMAGNIWEAWRRRRARVTRSAPLLV